MKQLSEYLVEKLNWRAVKQKLEMIFISSETSGDFVKKLKNILSEIDSSFGINLMDWSKMLRDSNNLEADLPYFKDYKVGDGTDTTAICLYKKGSDKYVILSKCLYNTGKDDNGLRKKYYGLKYKDAELEEVLRDAIATYNSLISNPA
jgi:hypothetical protein